MLLISFWQVLVLLVAFWSLKQAKNEGELGIVHAKARLKLNYMKNPSFGELQSLCQINQVCKEENQRKNLSFKDFATLCEIFATLCKIFTTLCKIFATLCKIFATLQNLPVIFRYFAPTPLDFYLNIFCVIIYSFLVIS